jgi:hypothetical protein
VRGKKKTLTRLASGFVILLVNTKFYSHFGELVSGYQHPWVRGTTVKSVLIGLQWGPEIGGRNRQMASFTAGHLYRLNKKSQHKNEI